MTSNQVLAQPEAMRPKTISMIAGAAAITAAAFVLFTNPAATARQANALSGSGEVMSSAMAAPGAGQALRSMLNSFIKLNLPKLLLPLIRLPVLPPSNDFH